MNQNKNLEVGAVLREAFGLLKENLPFLLLVYLIGLGLGLILIVPLFGLPFFFPVVALVGKSWGTLAAFLLVILVFFWFVAALLLGIWVQGAYYEAAVVAGEKQKLEVWAPFKTALRKLWLYFSANLLAGILIVLGLLLLIIPGILLAIRLFLVNLAVAQENTRAVASIQRSFQLTKGQSFPIFLIVLILLGLSIVVSLVPFVGQLLTGFLGLLGALIQAVIYKRVKGLG